MNSRVRPILALGSTVLPAGAKMPVVWLNRALLDVGLADQLVDLHDAVEVEILPAGRAGGGAAGAAVGVVAPRQAPAG